MESNTTGLLFKMFEEYAEYSYGKKAWELLGMANTNWSIYKKKKYLPLQQYKNICKYIGCHFTDDNKTICEHILKSYFAEMDVVSISGYGPDFSAYIFKEDV